MDSFASVLALWESRQAVAVDCAVDSGVVKQWQRRGSVPPDYWGALVRGAEGRGIQGVSLELFAQLAEARRTSGPPAQDAA